MHAASSIAEKLYNFIGYALGVRLERFDVYLRAGVYPGSHEPLATTDHLGHPPAFEDTLHAWIARGVNAARGRFGRFWSADEPVDTGPGVPLFGDAELEDSASESDWFVYVLTQVSKHGLLPNGVCCAGFTRCGWRFDETRTFKKPEWFSDPNKPDLPDEASLTLKRPKDLVPELSDDEVYEELVRQLRAR